MKLSGKLISGYFLIALLAVLVGYFGTRSANISSSLFDEVADETMPVIRTLDELRLAALRIIASTNEYGFISSSVAGERNKDKELAQTAEETLIKSGVESYEKALGNYEYFVTKSPHEKRFLEDIRKSGQMLLRSSKKLIEGMKQGASGAKLLELKEGLETNERDYLKAVDAALAHKTQELKERQQLARSNMSQMFYTILFSCIIIFLISTGSSVIVSRFIANPIKRLKTAVQRIGKGHFNTEVDIDSRDEIGDLASSFRDMTVDIKNYQKNLKAKNDFFSTVIDSMNDAISIIDPKNFAIVDVNSVFLRQVKLTKDEVIGKTCHEITHHVPEPCGNEPCPLVKTVVTGRYQTVEHIHHSLDGEKSYVEITTTPIRNESGEIAQVVYVSRDVTELKNTQAQILQREKMASIGQLAAGVAHEINNPMGFISSNLGTLGKYVNKLTGFINTQGEIIETLQSAEASEKLTELRKNLKLDYILEDVEQLIKESLDGTDRVKKIVQNLKSFSRVDEAEYKFADINECIESTLNIVWNELKYKATVTKEYGVIPQTRCWPQQMNQVFMNLLVNAAHAIEKQGEIKIKTWNGNGSVNISISDTGSGIPEDKINKIFEPFFTTKPAGKGTGLGLSITYDIVKKHNGEIAVDSEVGKGTTFTVRIPVVEGK